MANETDERTEGAHDGSGLPRSITLIVRTAFRPSADRFVRAKPLAAGERQGA